jgi:ribosomal protein S13
MATYYNYREPPEDLMRHYHPYGEDTDAVEWMKRIIEANEELQKELRTENLTEEEKEVVAKELLRNGSTEKIASGIDYEKLGQEEYTELINKMNEIREKLEQNIRNMYDTGLFKGLNARQMKSLIKQSRWFEELMWLYDISETELLDILDDTGIISYYEQLNKTGDIYGIGE